jgi:hypothetical protein
MDFIYVNVVFVALSAFVAGSSGSGWVSALNAVASLANMAVVIRHIAA